MKKTSTSKMGLLRKYTLALALSLLISGLFFLNYKDKTAQITSSDVAQKNAPTVALQQEQAATPPEMGTTTPVKRVKSASTKPEEKLAHKQGQALYAEAESENDEEAEEEKERQQKRNSYAEFLKNEFEMTKDPATGKVPRMAAFEALEAARKTKEFLLPQNALGTNVNGKEALPTVTVTPRGPFNFGGRVRQVGIDSRDNNILIAGGVSGVIKRSTDGGNSWTTVHPADQINSITCVAQDPRPGNQDTWYIGGGELYGNSASGTGATYAGHGILKSTDNGLNWAPMTPNTQGVLEDFDNQFDNVSKIIVNPTNGNLLVVGAQSVWVLNVAAPTPAWVKMLGAFNSSVGGDIILASDGTYYASINNDGVWRSNNNNPISESDWTKIAGVSSPKALPTGLNRIVLASSPANANLVYVFYNLEASSETQTNEYVCTNGAKSQARLERYNATGGTWTDFSNNISVCSNISGTKVITPQGGYNLAIAVKPDNADLVYLGGTEIYRFNAADNAYTFIGGDQGSPSGTNLHVDVHSLYFSDNTTLWSTNDGGIHKTNVTGTITAAPQGFQWDRKTADFNGYQFYRADISPTTGSGLVGGGAQDNANMIIPNGTTSGVELGGGDGVQHAIIAGTSNGDYNTFTSTQGGSLARRSFAGAWGVQPTDMEGDFKTYFLLDKDNQNIIYYPSSKIVTARNPDGSTLTTQPSFKLFRNLNANTLTNGSIAADGYVELTGVGTAIGANYIQTMATSYNAAYNNAAYTASNPARKLYLATSSAVFRLNDPAFCAVNTTPISLPAPGTGYISDIAVNPFNDSELLLTYSNYNTVSIYHSINAGANWTAVEGDATSAVGKASVRSALIVRSGTQTLYFVGTSTGLYATDALTGGTTAWSKIGGEVNKIGFSPCVSMRLRTSDNNFSVGTHGSGIFQLSVPAAVLPIELTTFTGKAVNKTNVLSWETASEINNKGFDIERSTDGSRFEKIGFVDGNGTTIKAQSYTFEDNTPLSISYYRLKQWDNDDRFELSKVIQISQKSTTKLNVYPNPVSNILTLETDSKGDYQVINIVGQTVLKGAANAQNIDVSALPIGTYFLQVGKEQVKFVKQ